MTRPDFDLLVVGGGPAGCATAIAAAQRGLRVALLQRDPHAPARCGESLPPSVRPLLEHLGVFDQFLASGPLPSYANRSLWGAGGAAIEYDFLKEPYGSGWQIDRQVFDSMLLVAAVRAGALVFGRAALRHVEHERDKVWRAITDGADNARTCTARMLVDASGRTRAAARRQGARFRPVDRLVAAVWRIPTRSVVDASTLVEAVPDGWWYSACLPDGSLTLSFFTDPDLLRVRDMRSVQGARDLLAEAPATLSRACDAGSCITSPPLVVSAASGRLNGAAGEGWLAAGDAAATFDPISSHGTGAALDAGIAAAAAVHGALAGNPAAVGAYDRRVRLGFASYLRLWHAVYGQETRWPAAPFWRRRHAAASRSG